MKFLSTILLFMGYTLVYASVAASGRFATEPWSGLFTDAYTGDIQDIVIGGKNQSPDLLNPNHPSTDTGPPPKGTRVRGVTPYNSGPIPTANLGPNG